MDKGKTGKTITIKINGSDQPFIESDECNKEKGKFITEEQSASILADQEVAAGEETLEESFDWILPEQDLDDVKEYKIYSYTKQQEEKDRYPSINSFKKMKFNRVNSSLIYSITFAILIGTSLGLLMLKLLNTEYPANKEANSSVISDNGQTGKQTNEAVKNSTEMIQLRTLPIYIIQAGVFSNEESAKQLQSTVAAKGFPSEIISTDGKSYLYVGVFNSLENARLLTEEFKEADIPIYAKEWSIGGTKVDNITQEEGKLLKTIPGLYDTIILEYTNAVQGKELSNKLTNVEEALKNIDETKLKNNTLVELRNSLLLATEKLSVYANKNNKELLLEVRQHLLSFVTAYGSL